jgi:methyl-accepting chemotaxis protein
MTLTIQRKLGAGFGVVLVLLVGALVLSLSALSGLNGRAQQLGGRDLVAVNALGNVRTGIMTMRAAGGDNLQVPTAAMKKVTANAVSSGRAAVVAGLSTYSQNIGGAADGRAFVVVRQDANAIIAGSDKTMALSAHGQLRAAVANYAATQPLMPPFNDAAFALANSRVKAARADTASAGSAYSSWRLILLMVAFVSVALGVGVAVLLSRKITSGIRQLMRAAEGIAEGDLEQSVSLESNDELGQTAGAFRRMIAYVQEMAQAAERVADGDLTVQVRPRSERDVLANAFGRLVANLSAAIGRVSAQATSVNSASKQMAGTSDEVGRAVSEIANAISDMAQGGERTVQMMAAAQAGAEAAAASVQASIDDVRETAEMAGEAREVTEQGLAAASEATTAMAAVRDSSQAASEAIGELSSKSQQIGSIVQTITGIAEQTNLLALNAAIEAARAGEQGRGFAVVAEEVRKLAEESQRAAGEIGTLINQVQSETDRAVNVVKDGASRTEQGAQTVEHTREAFERISGVVGGISQRIERITTFAENVETDANKRMQTTGKVSAAAEQSAASAEQVSASTEQTSASAQQIAASAQELSSNAEELDRLVAEFKLAS